MSLFDDFKNIDKHFYYDPFFRDDHEMEKPNPFREGFCTSTAKGYIEKYFTRAHKKKAFILNFADSYFDKGKHEHTVALYFLGCKLIELISIKLEAFIKQNLRSAYNHNFYYTWFLSCLYHDTTSVIEKAPYLQQSIEYYLGQHNVKYNVFNHQTMLPYADLFSFPEYLVSNYFNYRISYCTSVDHGILGGFLIYDRLRKNYNDAFHDYCKNNITDECTKRDLYINREGFVHNGLRWQIDHLDHFALIANSIIAHNIWFGKETDKAIYGYFGLEELMKSPENKICIDKRPLHFFLSLLDTIEPVKCLGRKKIGEKPIEALQKTEISLIEKNKIAIRVNEWEKKYCSWFDDIKEAESWLDINVDPRPNESVCYIKIK